MKYNAEYFIEKFKNIPPQRWIKGDFFKEGKCCALGHCGERDGGWGNKTDNKVKQT